MILLTEQHMTLFWFILGSELFAIRLFKVLEKWFSPIRVVFLKCEACLQGLRWGWEGEVSWFIWFSTRGGGGVLVKQVCVCCVRVCVSVCRRGVSAKLCWRLQWPFLNTIYQHSHYMLWIHIAFVWMSLSLCPALSSCSLILHYASSSAFHQPKDDNMDAVWPL